MTVLSRLHVSPAAARRYAAVALALLAGFYGLQWTANIVPQERSFAFVKRAFETGLLDAANDHVRPVDSVRVLGGLTRYSDCQALLSTVSPPSASLAEVLAPPIMRAGSRPCPALYQVAVEGEGSVGTLKTRYWHGAVAMVATLLHVPSLTLLQVTEAIKAASWFAWMLLALLAFVHSRRLFFVLGPVILAGVFVSAIPYFGPFSYGIPYLFSVLALVGLVRLMTVRAPASVLHLWFFAAGMVSSFVFLMDGHLILLVPVALLILHFGREEAGLREWATLAAGCLVAFAAGFVLSYFVNQAGKIMVLGWGDVVPHFFDQLGERLSTTTPSGERVSSAQAVEWLFRQGYPHTGFMSNTSLAGIFLAVAIVSFLASAVAAAQRAWQGQSLAPAAGFVVIAVAVGVALARVGLFPSHSVQHFFFMGRWMFVPLALTLVAPVALWGRRPEVALPPSPPSGSGDPERGRRGGRSG